LLPELTPVYLTFTIALELATAASHLPPHSGQTQFKMLETTSALALNLLNRINAIYHLSHRTGRSASIVPDAFPVPQMQREGA
jgi:predicted ATPase